MPNPKPTYFTTGNYSCRADLRAAIHHKRRKGKDWTQIGRECGVSDRTAKRCHSEEEAIRKEARAHAYQHVDRSGLTIAASKPTSGLSGAAFIYALLILLAVVGGVGYAYAH